MAYTATLNAVQMGGQPELFVLVVTYEDDADPDSQLVKELEITVDAMLSPGQQRAAIRAGVTADAQRYLAQRQIHAGLTELIGQSIVIGGV